MYDFGKFGLFKIERAVSINLLDLGSKARSKYELYKLLTCEANLYLPPYKECTIEFITDYLARRKKILKTSNVTVKSIPQVKGLRSEDLYHFVADHCGAAEYLPEIKNGRFPNPNSVNSNDLEDYIQDVMTKRQEEMLKSKGLTAEVDGDLAEAIARSKAISTIKGRSHLMLNTQRRDDWRAKKEMINEWPKQRDLINNMRKEIEKLQDKLSEHEDLIADKDKNQEILSRLFDKGIIDEDGNLLE